MNKKINECVHKRGSVSEIFFTTNLPSITGDGTKFYDGYCNDCQSTVYGRVGRVTVRWTTDRNLAFTVN